jgi:hypothetical protein
VDDLPFSQACENNKDPILQVLQRLFSDREAVLEIGAGTGQHAAWFAAHMPWLRWQPSDTPDALGALLPRCKRYAGDNLLAPVELDVSARPWSIAGLPDALFTANSLHIMPWCSVEDLFAELGELAGNGTVLAVYGPFNYAGQYTSESNARFDEWLAARDPASAIRGFEAVDALAQAAGFRLLEDNAMPANNRLIAWVRNAP